MAQWVRITVRKQWWWKSASARSLPLVCTAKMVQDKRTNGAESLRSLLTYSTLNNANLSWTHKNCNGFYFCFFSKTLSQHLAFEDITQTQKHNWHRWLLVQVFKLSWPARPSSRVCEIRWSKVAQVFSRKKRLASGHYNFSSHTPVELLDMKRALEA